MSSFGSQAIGKLRERVESVDGIWPIQFTDRAFTIPENGKYIREIIVGGVNEPGEIGGGAAVGGATARLDRRGHYQLEIVAPKDVGYFLRCEIADAIEDALRATPIRLDDGTPLMIHDVRILSLRDPVDQPRSYLPVVVFFQFLA